ncbi:MAG: F0F1 ATP synthase subunit A [Actinobacteria bacterium]|nr:F0F1 ATP synthase subunit A [Actinomycetota bacterium]
MTVAIPETAWGCQFVPGLEGGCGFPAPNASIFFTDPVFSLGPFNFTKPMLLLWIGVAIIVIFFLYAFMRPKLVPRGAQNLGELGYLFIRDGIVKDVIGKGGTKFVPFLFSFFFLIWILNLFEVIPVAQFPPTSMFALPVAFALIVYFTWVPYGFIKQGPGFLKSMLFPSGIPWPMYFLLTPIELLSNFIVRPFTHAVRLFANMFAGHLLLTTFAIAAWYLFNPASFSVVGVVGSAGSFLMLTILTAFEILIGALQAYIFTLLTAVYLSDAVSGH